MTGKLNFPRNIFYQSSISFHRKQQFSTSLLSKVQFTYNLFHKEESQEKRKDPLESPMVNM